MSNIKKEYVNHWHLKTDKLVASVDYQGDLKWRRAGRILNINNVPNKHSNMLKFEKNSLVIFLFFRDSFSFDPIRCKTLNFSLKHWNKPTIKRAISNQEKIILTFKVCCSMCQLITKGHSISKRLFGIFNSHKKRTKKFGFTTMVPQVELFFIFWSFLGRIEDTKKTFRN